ncbi:hypothetical protein DFQ28_002800 [Apophysomyces sp. BC1034]|nr:hypothetical protein DFQ30_003122 [Apophysomyces sp. BC1015]KAG0179471.1 hypothetical protein DFQ29_002056 [Apophysomyces sp. BC1021]KAG0189883.1 hypothetical protein DFQ28_002800 [Apophysomyces sp. BC1034]
MCQDGALATYDVPATDEAFKDELFSDICDAHCHPHDDIANLDLIPRLKTGHLTIMGVRQDDWDRVEEVARKCNATGETKCIPCFGLHPWYTHRVMTNESVDGTSQEHYDQVLKTSVPEEKSDLIRCLPPPVPYAVWYADLHRRLLENPQAIVGEAGLDRSARLLPGGMIEWHGVKPTTVQCTIEHQLAILGAQIDLARELDRAVSIHCVQAQGHLLQLLKSKGSKSSVRLCLHSYGGSPATIAQFLHLRGFAVYVSFSIAINGRLTPKKLEALIQAVPHDRLLIESDLNSPLGLDENMEGIARIVAHARQWSLDQAVRQTRDNWLKFVNMS